MNEIKEEIVWYVGTALFIIISIWIFINVGAFVAGFLDSADKKCADGVKSIVWGGYNFACWSVGSQFE